MKNISILALFIVSVMMLQIVGVQASALGQLQGIAGGGGQCFENCQSGGASAARTPSVDMNVQGKYTPVKSLKTTSPPALDSGVNIVTGTIDYTKLGYFQFVSEGKKMMKNIADMVNGWKQRIKNKLETKNRVTSVTSVRG